MIKESDGKLGVRETASLVLIMLVLKSTDTTPTILFKAAKNSGWITPIISVAFLTIPLCFLISLLKLYRDKNLIEIVYHLTGKYFGFIIGIMYFYMIFSELVVNSRSYSDIMNVFFFPRTPNLIIYLLLTITIYFIASRGYENLGRTAWMFTPMLQIIFIIFVFFTRKDMYFDYVYPLFGDGVGKTIETGITYSTYLGNIFYIALFYRYTRNHGDFVKATAIGLGVSVVEIIIMLFLYAIVFDYPSIVFSNYPFQQLSRIVTFGDSFRNTEAFFYGIWVAAAMIRFSTVLYLSTATLAYTLKLKEFEPLIMPLAALVPMIGSIPENLILNVFVLRRYLLQYAWIVLFFIPVILYLIARIRGDYRR